MNLDVTGSAIGAQAPGPRAFTLAELLVVIGVIALVAALLLPTLSRARAQGQNASCMNHLRQMGLALQMYVSDHQGYPPALETEPVLTWADRLFHYYPVRWTNANWHCPTYIADRGEVMATYYHNHRQELVLLSSYSYNARGIDGGTNDHRLGLGMSTRRMAIRDPEVLTPSEMYAVGDARPYHIGPLRGGRISMSAYFGGGGELAPPHARGYNLLFCDGHVTLVKRNDYLFPPRTAHNWNRDNQAHPEAWAPRSQWAVQN
jgi:prepilin-type processing-associated H-X9-DG protein/prepilin-type N-terminal cleavage/methylation domain-containing protein